MTGRVIQIRSSEGTPTTTILQTITHAPISVRNLRNIECLHLNLNHVITLVQFLSPGFSTSQCEVLFLSELTKRFLYCYCCLLWPLFRLLDLVFCYSLLYFCQIVFGPVFWPFLPNLLTMSLDYPCGFCMPSVRITIVILCNSFLAPTIACFFFLLEFPEP